jgi:phosphatidylserine decarboxylase
MIPGSYSTYIPMPDRKGLFVVRDAYKFFLPFLALGILSVVYGLFYLSAPFFILAAFICFFFRNPERCIPEGKNLIISPADGKIVKISRINDEEQAISIFLSIFNVHVNRSPIAGELQRVEYKRGKFKAAFEDEASKVNEQNILTIAGQDIRIVVRQIAGLIARRVVCWKKPGDPVARGELFGLIRFGSRVDIVLPADSKIRVQLGDKVKGGSSILGEYL